MPLEWYASKDEESICTTTSSGSGSSKEDNQFLVEIKKDGRDDESVVHKFRAYSKSLASNNNLNNKEVKGYNVIVGTMRDPKIKQKKV